LVHSYETRARIYPAEADSLTMESLIALAAVVGIAWGAVVFLRGGLMAGSLAVLLAGTCFGYYLFHVEAGPVPLTSDRVLWTLLMVQFAGWWRLGLTDPRRAGRSEVVLLLFMATLLASVLTHDWSVDNNLPASRLLFYYLMPLGMYWVGSRMPTTERGVRWMFALLGIFGLYLAVTAVAEVRGWSWLVVPSYIASPEHPEFLGRARGPLLNPAGNGFLLGLCLGGGLMIWPWTNRPGKLLLAAATGVLCAGIFYTLTRSAWMGGAGGLLIVVLFVLPRFYRPWLLAAVVLGAATVVVTQWENLVEFKRDKDLSARQTAKSVELRPILAGIAWEMFCHQPLVGCGLGHYTQEHVNYLHDRDIDIPLEVGRGFVQHNVWLSLLTETGLLGTGLFIIFTAAWLWNGWRLWQTRAAPLWMRQQGLLFLVVAANYTANGMFQDMTIIPMVHMIVFFMAGMTMNLQARAAGVAERATTS
jgi:O-antigen ligase